MKNLLFFLSFLFFTQINFVKAESWDYMSKEQAEALLAYVNKNPFIFNYCDCCNDIIPENKVKPKAHLLKIEKMEIVPCPFDNTLFSVDVLECTVVATANVSDGFVSITKTESDDKRKYAIQWALSLNYCFTLIDFVIPSRLYEAIDYKAEPFDCSGLIEFPDPELVPEHPLKKAYSKYYKSKK